MEYDLIFGGLRIEGKIRQKSNRYYRNDYRSVDLSPELDRHTVQVQLSAQDAHVTGGMKDRGIVHLSAGDDK